MSPIKSPRRERVASFSPKHRREELCYCTEELGSESISNSCTVPPPAPSVLQFKLAPATEACCHGENTLSNCTLPMYGISTTNSTLPKLDLSGLRDGDSYDREPSCLGTKSTLSTHRLSTHVRTFPPPISSLLSDRPLMRSFKFNGRFVLQRVDSDPTNPFRAIREDGRLRLELTSPYWSLTQAVDEEEEKTHPLATIEVVHEKCGIKDVDASENQLKELEEVLIPFKQEGIKKAFFHHSIAMVLRAMKPFHYWNPASKCLPTLDFSIMSQKLNAMASALSSYERWKQTKPKLGTNMRNQELASSQALLQKSRERKATAYAIICLRVGLICLLLESSSVGFKIKGVYCFSYRKLSDQGGKKGGMQHLDLVSNFNCVKEEALLMPLQHARDGFNLVKTVDFKIAA